MLRVGVSISHILSATTFNFRFMKVNKKCILSLRLPSKYSFTLSKLRFFGLSKPKTTSFYSL